MQYKAHFLFMAEQVSESLSLMVFLGTAGIGVHVVHTSRVNIAYKLESLWLNKISDNERCYIHKISHSLILVWNISNADDCYNVVCNMVSYWIKIYQESTASVNSFAPGKFEWNFRYLIFQIISVIDGWVISCELALSWMSLDLTDDDKSTWVQVMAWCRETTSHYLSPCWPRSLWPYGVTRPQWVK